MLMAHRVGCRDETYSPRTRSAKTRGRRFVPGIAGGLALVMTACGTFAPASSPRPSPSRSTPAAVSGYQPAPPQHAPAGSVITIRGHGFGATAGSVLVCEFCSTPAAIQAKASISRWLPTRIEAVIPGLQNGEATVYVILPSGRRLDVGPIVTGGAPEPPARSSTPDISAIHLDYPPSPDGSMPTGLTLVIAGQSLGHTVGADRVAVSSGAGQLLASAVLGSSGYQATVLSWNAQQIVLTLTQPWMTVLQVTVDTRGGSTAWTIDLPSGIWQAFRVWGTTPAVAAEYFPPGTLQSTLSSLNAQAQAGTFPLTAEAAEHALPGGTADPVKLIPMGSVENFFLWEPSYLVDGLVPSGVYLVYTGRSFPDALAGKFTWVLVPNPIGPAAFTDAARLQVLATCRGSAQTQPCP